MHFAAFTETKRKKAPITALIYVIDITKKLMNGLKSRCGIVATDYA